MGRTFVGSLLFGWGFLVIGANSGNDPYATTGDLYFGVTMVAVGLYLAGTGIYRARTTSSTVLPASAQRVERPGDAPAPGGGQASAPAGVVSSAHIGREMFVGLFVSVVS